MNNKPHSHSHSRSRSSSSRTNLASCVVATIFLIFVAIIILIVFFTIFKPKDPSISVKAVQLPTFIISNGRVNFTFSQYNSVKNPNRAEFTHYDSNLQLLYAGNQVGFMFIPSGTIDAGRTKYMSATFSVQSFPVAVPRVDAVDGVSMSAGELGSVLEIESVIKMAGRVRVLQILTHHVETKIVCKVLISVSDGTVIGLRC